MPASLFVFRTAAADAAVGTFGATVLITGFEAPALVLGAADMTAEGGVKGESWRQKRRGLLTDGRCRKGRSENDERFGGGSIGVRDLIRENK